MFCAGNLWRNADWKYEGQGERQIERKLMSQTVTMGTLEEWILPYSNYWCYLGPHYKWQWILVKLIYCMPPMGLFPQNKFALKCQWENTYVVMSTFHVHLLEHYQRKWTSSLCQTKYTKIASSAEFTTPTFLAHEMHIFTELSVLFCTPPIQTHQR